MRSSPCSAGPEATGASTVAPTVVFLPAASTVAASTRTMDVDELRVCQLWMYGLATRLQACHTLASDQIRVTSS